MRFARYLALLAVALVLPLLAGCHERERTVVVHRDYYRGPVVVERRSYPDRYYYYDRDRGGPRDGNRGGPRGGDRDDRSRGDRDDRGRGGRD